MDTKEILIKAKKLIENPDNWCQFSQFNGKGYCAVGAIRRVFEGTDENMGNPIKSQEYVKYVKVLKPHVPHDNVAYYNNHHTHEEVLALFDKAIASFNEEKAMSFQELMESLEAVEA